jgi:hypothetical protein
MRKTRTKAWKYRVVKRMRGGAQGEYFDFPTAATFVSEADARAYAETFARESCAAGVYTAEIVVRTRAGGWPGHRGVTVATYKAGDYKSGAVMIPAEKVEV